MSGFTPQEAIYVFRNCMWDIARELRENGTRKTDQHLANMLMVLGYSLSETQQESSTTDKVRESIREAVAEFWKGL